MKSQWGAATLVLVPALLLAAAHPTFAQAPDSEEKVEELRGEDCIAVLEKIASATKANFESLTTWSADWTGEIRLYSKARKGPAGERPPQLAVATFKLQTAVDLKDNKVLSRFEAPTTNYSNAEIGAPIERRSGVDLRIAVLTPEQYLFFDGSRGSNFPDLLEILQRLKDVRGRDFVRKSPKEFGRRDRVHMVDPRAFFQTDLSYAWDNLTIYTKRFRDGNAPQEFLDLVRNNLSVRRSTRGTRETCTLVVVRKYKENEKQYGAEGTLHELTFDSDAGWNLTSWKHTLIGKGIAGAKLLEWRRIEGVYVPSRMSEQIFGVMDAGSKIPVISATYVAGQMTINQPIDPEKFTLSAFDVKDGDRVWDEIERRVTIYDGKRLAPIDEFLAGKRDQK